MNTFDDYRDFLFDYSFDGHRWSVTITARSAEEAKARINSLAWATYTGELLFTVPATPAGALRRVLRWLWR